MNDAMKNAIEIVLVDSLSPEIKRSVACMVAGGRSPESIAGAVRENFPQCPLVALAVERFAELCWIARSRRSPLQ